MHSCEAAQNLLLEYVFDLLDDGERLAVQEHLAGCAACSAALARTQQQQRLLAAAARLECSDVHFEPPTPEVVPPAEKTATVLPLPRRAPDSLAALDHRRHDPRRARHSRLVPG